MQILICSIKMPIRHTENEVIRAAQEIVRLNCIFAEDFWIYKQSLDARKKNNIHYVYSVAATVPDDTVCNGKDIIPLMDGGNLEIPQNVSLDSRPVVVGTGPCGLFAAYVLAKSGNPPIVIERGEKVEDRVKTIESFWAGGMLNPNSNVQFGEGGAGTFSDGKLNTGVNNPRIGWILQQFVKAGADYVTIHVEADQPQNTLEALDKIHSLGCKAGIVLKPRTPAEAAIPALMQQRMIPLQSPPNPPNPFLPHPKIKNRTIHQAPLSPNIPSLFLFPALPDSTATSAGLNIPSIISLLLHLSISTQCVDTYLKLLMKFLNSLSKSLPCSFSKFLAKFSIPSLSPF